MTIEWTRRILREWTRRRLRFGSFYSCPEYVRFANRASRCGAPANHVAFRCSCAGSRRASHVKFASLRRFESLRTRDLSDSCT